MTHSPPAPGPPPQVIYLIRHAEKSGVVNGTTFIGVELTGVEDHASLIPEGWQRAGGLATLFDTAAGTMRPDLARPGHLYAPNYGEVSETVNHRMYQTIVPLSLRLGVPIDTTYPEGKEHPLAEWILANDAGVSLVCWEHAHIPKIARHLPVLNEAAVPTSWPDDCFDVIWSFTQSPSQPGRYTFAILAQRLLYGDRPA
jgi:hypothetical protein